MTAYRAPQHFEEAFSHSFLTQFISLILFVLIFSIAAFMPKEPVPALAAAPRKAVAQVGDEAKPEPLPLATISSSTLFAPGSARIQGDDLAGISLFLKSHDVQLEAVLREPAATHDLIRIGRLEALTDYFVSLGVPREAIRVLGVEGDSTAIDLKVYRGQAS